MLPTSRCNVKPPVDFNTMSEQQNLSLIIILLLHLCSCSQCFESNYEQKEANHLEKEICIQHGSWCNFKDKCTSLRNNSNIISSILSFKVNQCVDATFCWPLLGVHLTTDLVNPLTDSNKRTEIGLSVEALR